ncbi:MAG: hypothetical protein WBF53_05975, partial [Litorimonas sp.]
MTLDFTGLWNAFGWAILHSLWQGALIAGLVCGLRQLATERRAQWRYAVGMAGLLAMFAAFLATFVALSMNMAIGWQGMVADGGSGVVPGAVALS